MIAMVGVSGHSITLEYELAMANRKHLSDAFLPACKIPTKTAVVNTHEVADTIFQSTLKRQKITSTIVILIAYTQL